VKGAVHADEACDGHRRCQPDHGREGRHVPRSRHPAERIREACERNGWDLLKIEPEMDVSGGKPLAKRPGLSKAVEAIENGSADIVAVPTSTGSSAAHRMKYTCSVCGRITNQPRCTRHPPRDNDAQHWQPGYVFAHHVPPTSAPRSHTT
jgi:hypothetical protein